MKTDLPIGFRFVDGDDILEVREYKTCKECHFITSDNTCRGLAFACTANIREDGNEVSFAKVGEVQHE